MAFLDFFIGTSQSKYAGIAILASLVVVAVAMLARKDAMPLGQKFAFILVSFLFALPGMAVALFQLTCLVTGSKGSMHPCGLYAWIGAILIILYSVGAILIALLAIANGTDVAADLNAMDAFQAKKVAQSYFATGSAEGFADEDAAAVADATMPPEDPAKPATAEMPVIEGMDDAVDTPDAHEPELFTTCGAPL